MDTTGRLRLAAATLVPALAVLAVQMILFPLPLGVTLQGVIVGLLGALVAVGMALVYRANRILNFAQVQLGLAPTVLAVSLIVYAGVNYFLAVTVGLLGSLLLGSLVELVIIRRFFNVAALDTHRRHHRTVAVAGSRGALHPADLGPAAHEQCRARAHLLDLHRLPVGLHGRRRGGADHRPRGPARRGPDAALQQHRHRRPGQRRAGGSGQPARDPGQASADRGVGRGRRALVHRGLPSGRHPGPAPRARL